jgi:GT2 family glycosyltransferase
MSTQNNMQHVTRGEPTISVLMPTFKHPPFIRRAIESLLAQTLEDWELVIVDDGSPDDTGAVVASYLNDPRVYYERLDRNQGLGAALNHATGLACGRYLAYLPSDDLYYPDPRPLTPGPELHPLISCSCMRRTCRTARSRSAGEKGF